MQFKHNLSTLLPDGSRVLAAVSGGIDSMCMLEMLERCDIDYAIAHCNFHLRGDESDGDAEFVKSWAERHKVVFYGNDFETDTYASGKGISIEMAARELRYGWFSELCKIYGFYATIVAHNANDNAETLILNLLRGTGGKGIRGISASADYPCKIIRPMLEFSRDEIAEWMKENDCEWREDRTNTDTLFKRNKIRHEIFPLFAQINPSYLDTLSRDMKHFAMENDIAQEYWLSIRDSLTDADGNILTDVLTKDKHWKYLLYRLTEHLGLNSDIFDSLTRAIESGQNISGKLFGPIIASRDKLILNGKVSDRNIQIRKYPRTETLALKRNDGTLLMDAARISLPLTIRHWQEGDWMIPFGMKGRKKLSDIFADLKYSPVDKQNALVIEYQGICGRIAAIVGQRIDDSLKITDDTTEIIEVKPI